MNLSVIPDNFTEEEVLNYNRGGNYLVTESGHLYIRNVRHVSVLYVLSGVISIRITKLNLFGTDSYISTVPPLDLDFNIIALTIIQGGPK